MKQGNGAIWSSLLSKINSQIISLFLPIHLSSAVLFLLLGPHEDEVSLCKNVIVSMWVSKHINLAVFKYNALQVQCNGEFCIFITMKPL